MLCNLYNYLHIYFAGQNLPIYDDHMVQNAVYVLWNWGEVPCSELECNCLKGYGTAIGIGVELPIKYHIWNRNWKNRKLFCQRFNFISRGHTHSVSHMWVSYTSILHTQTSHPSHTTHLQCKHNAEWCHRYAGMRWWPPCFGDNQWVSQK